MAYRIDFSHPLEQEVRRIASAQLSSAAGLLEEQPDGPHEAIHDARKHIKRTRALYRLIAGGARQFAASENDRLRTIAAGLAHFRDAAALAESARYLEATVDSEDISAAIHKVGAVLERRREKIAGDEADIGEKLKAAATALRDAEHAVEDLELPSSRKSAAKCLSEGWANTGRKAIKALAACEAGEDELPFHDLRKRAQDRWMHASLLRPAWPTAMTAMQRAAKFLVDQLGHEHDLAVLEEHIGKSDAAAIADRKDIILLAIHEQRQKLQIACKKAAKDIFDARPGRDAASVRLLIRNL